MRLSWPLALLLLAAPPAGAHNTYEAAELEVHVLDDEGTDLMESYGGYDVQDAFVGFAHDPAVGAGEAGDGLYVRIELYGDRAESAAPQGGANWSVEVTMGLAGADRTFAVWTTDGAAFASTFDALAVAVEGRDAHVQRAFLSYARAGVRPGDPVAVRRVESRVDGDLRDVAPGGIPVPGTGGAQEYPDPTAIPGQGLLAGSVPARAPDHYVRVTARATGPGAYAVAVASALRQGGQHAFVDPIDLGGYALEGTTSEALPANGTMEFRLASADGASGPARIEVRTDVGGRAFLWLDGEGLHGPAGLLAASIPPPAAPSPGVGLLVVLLVLGLAALQARRRRR